MRYPREPEQNRFNVIQKPGSRIRFLQFRETLSFAELREDDTVKVIIIIIISSTFYTMQRLLNLLIICSLPILSCSTNIAYWRHFQETRDKYFHQELGR